VESQSVPPEQCLRSLTAEALLRAQPERALLPDSLGVMATANAFVMLGLVAEDRAEEILAGHRAGLEAKGMAPGRGVNAGELTVRPGAHEYWTARGDSVAALSDLPLRVLPARARLPVSVSGQPGEICFEWLTLTRSGWRMTYRASGSRAKAEPEAAGTREPPSAVADQVLAQVVVADDTGHRYQLASGRGGGWLRTGRSEWELHGEAAAEPNVLSEPGWLEFGNTAVGDRVRIQPPPDIPVGTAEPPWPTPAEAFTEELARINGMNLNGTELTPDQTAGIVATVADCLLAVGALPTSSALLREPRTRGQERQDPQGWHAQLADRWSRRAWQQAAGAGFRLADHRGLTAELPLKHATAIIESVSAHGGLVIIRLYGHPWVMGEYWPMITPCFTVRAADEDGNSYRGMPGSWHGGTSHQGSGEFWFWPPVPEACERLTITVSTLWEAAWADVDLPGRTD
jgi:hypothetical protein